MGWNSRIVQSLGWIASRKEFFAQSGILLAESAARGYLSYDFSKDLLVAIPIALTAFLFRKKRSWKWLVIPLAVSLLFDLDKVSPIITKEYNVTILEPVVDRWSAVAGGIITLLRGKEEELRGKTLSPSEMLEVQTLNGLEKTLSMSFSNSYSDLLARLNDLQGSFFSLREGGSLPSSLRFPPAFRPVDQLGIPQMIVHLMRHPELPAASEFFKSSLMTWCVILLSHIFNHAGHKRRSKADLPPPAGHETGVAEETADTTPKSLGFPVPGHLRAKGQPPDYGAPASLRAESQSCKTDKAASAAKVTELRKARRGRDAILPPQTSRPRSPRRCQSRLPSTIPVVQ